MNINKIPIDYLKELANRIEEDGLAYSTGYSNGESDLAKYILNVIEVDWTNE